MSMRFGMAASPLLLLFSQAHPSEPTPLTPADAIGPVDDIDARVRVT